MSNLLKGNSILHTLWYNTIKKKNYIFLIDHFTKWDFICVPHPKGMWCQFLLVLQKWPHWISTPILSWNDSSNLQQFLRNSRNQESDIPVLAVTRKYFGSNKLIFTFSEKRRLLGVHYCLWHQCIVGHFVLCHGFELAVFSDTFQSVFAQVLTKKEWNAFKNSMQILPVEVKEDQSQSPRVTDFLMGVSHYLVSNKTWVLLKNGSLFTKKLLQQNNTFCPLAFPWWEEIKGTEFPLTITSYPNYLPNLFLVSSPLSYTSYELGRWRLTPASFETCEASQQHCKLLSHRQYSTLRVKLPVQSSA